MKPKQQKNNQKAMHPFVKQIVGTLVAILLVLIFVFGFVINYEYIGANERGVKVGISGLTPEPLQPGLVFYCPFTTKLFIANIGQQRFVMNDVDAAVEKSAHGRAKDEQVFRSVDNQDMHVSMSIQWHRNPAKVVDQQSLVGNVADDEHFVEAVLRQPVIAETKNALTIMKAIDAYSGPSHVNAQKAIFEALKSNHELVEKGCVIDTYVVEVTLDKDYTQPIKDRQTAMQQQLSYVEQTKAADAKALQAKAEAQADLNKVVVAAERDKQVAILKAEQEQKKVILEAEGANQQVVLAAEAAKQQVVMAAEAEKMAGKNRAEAIMAVGTANAETEKLKYSAYAAPGAEVYAKIEMAKSLALAYSGVKGWIPKDMTINTFAEDFNRGVGVVVNPQAK